MEHETIPGTPEAAAVAEALPPGGALAIANAPNGNGTEKRSQVIVWFLGLTLVLLVLAYATVAGLSAYQPPQEGAYTIITGALKDMKEILLIVVGVLGGAVTQKHA